MQGEIVRILSNSLKYLHELSLAGTPMPIRRNIAARQQSVQAHRNQEDQDQI